MVAPDSRSVATRHESDEVLTTGVRQRSAAHGAGLVLPFSASTRDALQRQLRLARALTSKIETQAEAAALCRAFAERCRPDGVHRTVLVAQALDELRRQLDEPHKLVAAHPPERPRLIFVCSGHGSQWQGMGQTLLATEPAFYDAVARCDAFVRERYGWSVLAALSGAGVPADLDAVDVSQLCIATVQLAFGQLWNAWGITPDAFVGHSLGEATACGLAGILSLEDTLTVVGERGAVLRELQVEPGGMMVVTLPRGQTSIGVRQLCRDMDLAAYNSWSSLVLSGAVYALRRMEPQLKAEGFRPERVAVSYASHCAHVEAAMRPLRSRLQNIMPQPGRVPVRGTSQEGWLVGPECGAEFWAQNLRRPVLFRHAIQALTTESPAVFVELSPHPVLLDAVAQTVDAEEVLTLASGSRDNERRTLLTSLARLFSLGFKVDWSAVGRTSGASPHPFAHALEDVFGPHGPRAT